MQAGIKKSFNKIKCFQTHKFNVHLKEKVHQTLLFIIVKCAELVSVKFVINQLLEKLFGSIIFLHLRIIFKNEMILLTNSQQGVTTFALANQGGWLQLGCRNQQKGTGLCFCCHTLQKYFKIASLLLQENVQEWMDFFSPLFF